MLAADGLDPFHSLRSNPHAAVGAASIICTCIQPVMAAFRPHPGTRYALIKSQGFVFFFVVLCETSRLASTKVHLEGGTYFIP